MAESNEFIELELLLGKDKRMRDKIESVRKLLYRKKYDELGRIESKLKTKIKNGR